MQKGQTDRQQREERRVEDEERERREGELVECPQAGPALFHAASSDGPDSHFDARICDRSG